MWLDDWLTGWIYYTDLWLYGKRSADLLIGWRATKEGAVLISRRRGFRTCTIGHSRSWTKCRSIVLLEVVHGTKRTAQRLVSSRFHPAKYASVNEYGSSIICDFKKSVHSISRVCSAHFLEADFQVSSLLKRKFGIAGSRLLLKPSSVPSIKKPQDENASTSSPTSTATSTSSLTLRKRFRSAYPKRETQRVS